MNPVTVIATAGLIALGGAACAQEADIAGPADAPDVSVETTETTAAGPRTPTPADFTITLVETSRSCFGSAGCNVQGFPELSYVTVDDIDDEGCTVTYSIDGAESTTTESLTLTGDGEYEYFDFYVSTGSDVPLSATVTQVVCR